MKKAQIEVQERLKLVDVIVELLDARIPLSSRNEVLFRITKDKLRLVVLTKKDLADPKETEKWINFFKNEGFSAVFSDLNNSNDVKNIVREVEKLGERKNQKFIDKGMKPQPVRAMIIGIPNVGKSTLINKISGRHAASVQNKPGHTKAQQWIKVSNKFELLDTPGILPPSFEDNKKAINLALVGSISQEILPNDELAKIAFNFIKESYKNNLQSRFEYLNLDESVEDCFKEIAVKRGYFSKGGQDIDKAHKVFLNEVKNGLLGQITFERI
jgi:ribosome biogenesis GTPase A